jgi:hypothetical protein
MMTPPLMSARVGPRRVFSMYATAVLVATFALAGACAESTLEPLPLDITVAANKTTTVPGDTIVFVATVQGGSLLGLNVDYGDGAVDTYGTSGARTGKVSFHHAFSSRGTFTTRISVTDAVAGVKDASIQIRVN